MRPSLRFLLLAVVGWAGVRAASMGVLPGAAMFRPAASHADPLPAASPLPTTEFPAIEPIPAAPASEPPPFQQASLPAEAPPPGWLAALRALVAPARTLMRPHGSSSVTVHLTPLMPTPRQYAAADLPELDEWPLSRLASESRPAARSEAVAPMQSPAPALAQAKLDRVQLSMWSLLRSTRTLAVAPSPSLAPMGQLGGSQAGLRLIYNLNSLIGVALRASNEVGRRGGELALGVRVHPLQSVPVWITAERRKRIGAYGGGRDAWALFAEGGLYDRPLPGHFLLNAYGQAGVVGARRRDIFAEGAATVTRPVYKQFSAGVGVWAGMQPNVYRVDVGPRVTMRVRKNVRVHFDYRQRVAGNALPDSGPAVTLAGDF